MRITMTLYRVKWKSRITGHEGQRSELCSCLTAKHLCEVMSSKFPDLIYWSEPVEVVIMEEEDESEN